ncbi:MAG: succinate dehydrogenase, hydrophobic membrane anchor protein [Rhizobiales bacterium]|jgi:succinate dehydrogenase / fumarate reductase membrane anchor subunit|nr:succinate dehydrogenase, hydrophobic membrane anchor protein [Hyphomicrobiales bacterium]
MSTTQNNSQDMRTPTRRVRHLGAAHSGTRHFWHQRLTAVAAVPLTLIFIVVAMTLIGRNHAATVQILGSPLVAIVMMLFVLTTVYHMWLGMQVIVEDYIHHEFGKVALIMGNTFFCIAVGVACAFALLKLSFGV